MSLTTDYSAELKQLVQLGKVMVFLLMLNVIATVGAAAFAGRTADRLAPPAWEYRIEFFPDAQTLQGLQRLGADRWEVIDIRRARGEGDIWGAEVTLRRAKH
jgi:hypothetical protein